MISSISLKNFKCFEDVTFGLKRLSLLAGLNGTGKSTVLQALLLLRQSFLDSSLESTGLSLNSSIIDLGTGKDVFYHNAEDEKISFTLRIDDKKEFGWSFLYDAEANVLQHEKRVEATGTYSELALFTDKFDYLQAERIGPRVAYEVSDYQVRQHSQLGSRGQYVAHFLHHFGAKVEVREQLRHVDAKSNDLNAQVESWLRELRPDIRFNVDAHPSIDQMVLTYAFVSGEVTSRPIRSINTGFGLTYVLPVLTALLASKEGALIVLENPEAHIHPKGQSLIGELIARAASAGTQLIVETHSDHILNGIRIAVLKGILDYDDVSIHFLSAEEDRIVVHNPKIDQNGRIDHWPPNFFDEWEKSIEEFLKPPPK